MPGVSVYDERPWLARYPAGQPAHLTPQFDSALAMFRATVARDPDAALIHYFDATITAGEIDELTDAFAVALLRSGVEPGDRVALYLQNVPQFVIGLVGAWKAGAVAVSINPMNKARELASLLQDSGARVLVCLDELYRDVAREVAPTTAVHTVFTTSARAFQTRDDPRAFRNEPSSSEARSASVGVGAVTERDHDDPDPGASPGVVLIRDLLEALDEVRGEVPPEVSLGPDDVAFLTYTSGTTGPPKGAMNTHGNVVFNTQTYRQWCDLSDRDTMLGVSPLFHITGLIAQIGVTLLTGAPLVLFHRFEPSLTVDVIREHRPTFAMGSITIFIALMNAPGADREAMSSITTVLSGGAPIPPSTVTVFEERFGVYIHNFYGLTETTSPSHGVPIGVEAPVDPTSGALSIGVPLFDTVVRVVGEDGADLPAGEVGEIVISGPQVVPGYWRKPEETAHAFPQGRLHTGDVGYMDHDGWFYLIDRKKDQINASGYKVWPREVEDVLYEHEAVREAAVIGVADEYRGETVKAFVSLRPDARVTPEELIGFCKARLAAYKYPRAVEVLEELPKSAVGKLLRRELRVDEDG